MSDCAAGPSADLRKIRGALSMIDWLTALAATTIKTLRNDTQYEQGLLFNSTQDSLIIKDNDDHNDIWVPIIMNRVTTFKLVVPYFFLFKAHYNN